MRTSLVATVNGSDRPGNVEQLSDAVLAAGANWKESRTARLAGKFAGILRISVAAAKAESLKSALAPWTARVSQSSLRPAASPRRAHSAPSDWNWSVTTTPESSATSRGARP